MIPNVKPSQIFPHTGLHTATGSIAAQSISTATVNGAWIKVPTGSKWMSVKLNIGANATSALVDVDQATSSGGAGAKALVTAGAFIAADAVANRTDEAEVNLDQALDINNGFLWVRVKATTVGVAIVAVTVAFGPAAFLA